MEQYLQLLQAIKSKGTLKPAARENMPSTQSLFGYQFRHDLKNGFPILTTKKISFKNIVTELLWFLRGDTNIKFLIERGCNIWNEDAYNYYQKLIKKYEVYENYILSFDDFIVTLSNEEESKKYKSKTDFWFKNLYLLGECGHQYGKLWRDFEGVDQIAELIKGLKNNTESRRHMLTGLNPQRYNDLALFPCHVLAQFNCRPMTAIEPEELHGTMFKLSQEDNASTFFHFEDSDVHSLCNDANVPKYKLDCHSYQRSADVFLGVPYNIASYALLTHILAKICNFEVGEIICSYGDVHIYSNHVEQVNEQLNRNPTQLPSIELSDYINWQELGFNLGFEFLEIHNFKLNNYHPQDAIKAKLSTGLK